MVFLCVLFAERADFLLRKGKLAFMPTAALMLIPAFMFMIRTALAAVMVMAFFCALLLSSERVVSWGRRALLLTLALVFAGVVLTTSTSIGQDIQSMWQTRGSRQQTNMEWRAERDVGPVHHQLPEFTQIHVHRVGDAIQPSHPLSSPSPPAPNPSQHQGLFQ